MGILGTIDNDVTVTQEINPIQGAATPAIVSQTGDEDKKEKTVVMDGPLSAIYTKALNLVFAKTEENVSIETQQMDSVMVADAHNFMQKQEKLKQEDMDRAAYAYVTDADTITRSPGASFDELRIALDMETQAEKIVCIECLSEEAISQVEIFSNYAESHPSKPKVFFSRQLAIEYLSKR